MLREARDSGAPYTVQFAPGRLVPRSAEERAERIGVALQRLAEHDAGAPLLLRAEAALASPRGLLAQAGPGQRRNRRAFCASRGPFASVSRARFGWF